MYNKSKYIRKRRNSSDEEDDISPEILPSTNVPVTNEYKSYRKNIQDRLKEDSDSDNWDEEEDEETETSTIDKPKENVETFWDRMSEHINSLPDVTESKDEVSQHSDSDIEVIASTESKQTLDEGQSFWERMATNLKPDDSPIESKNKIYSEDEEEIILLSTDDKDDDDVEFIESVQGTKKHKTIREKLELLKDRQNKKKNDIDILKQRILGLESELTNDNNDIRSTHQETNFFRKARKDLAHLKPESVDSNMSLGSFINEYVKRKTKERINSPPKDESGSSTQKVHELDDEALRTAIQLEIEKLKTEKSQEQMKECDNEMEEDEDSIQEILELDDESPKSEVDQPNTERKRSHDETNGNLNKDELMDETEKDDCFEGIHKKAKTDTNN